MSGIPASFALRKARCVISKNREEIVKKCEKPIAVINKLIEDVSGYGQTCFTVSHMGVEHHGNMAIEEYDWPEIAKAIKIDLEDRGYTVTINELAPTIPDSTPIKRKANSTIHVSWAKPRDM